MSLTFFLLSDIFLRGVKDALSYSSVEGEKKKTQNVIFQVVSQKWDVKMNAGAGLEAAVFTSI